MSSFCVHEEELNGFVYHVYYDDIHPLDTIDISIFESDEELKEWLLRFENDEVALYFVRKMKKCDCCENYKTIDVLGAIEAESPSKALDYYVSNYDSTEGE